MATQTVEFEYRTGLTRRIFRNARLRGSWDAGGRYSDQWSESPMRETVGDDGCPTFTASVTLDLADQARTFSWGVALDGPQGSNFWGIPTEVQDASSTARTRPFRLSGAGLQRERYYLTYCRRLGANKHHGRGGAAPDLRFGVWAPNATKVDVVFGDPAHGYISDSGIGIDPARPVVPLQRMAGGIWEGRAPGGFDTYRSLPYMYRIVNAEGQTVYRTDIFSRSQIGRGSIDPAIPATGSWPGTVETLDGTVSCSVVIDADVVRRGFLSTPPQGKPDLVPADEFWAREFTPGMPVPATLGDLIVYELHVGALGFGKPTPGDLSDAVAFLDHLVDLGVNAVELLPMAEFSGAIGWGYGDTHQFCIESSAGGRDKYRHFVRECHRRGIAVIQDVCYNHYDLKADRAEWQYDSTTPEQNIFYWYEGPEPGWPNGSYVENGSSGFTPRFWEEVVRQHFISSAAFLLEEMHVDGLRVDLTQAIHRDNRRYPDGPPVGSANVFGQKFLREWSRTLKMIRPTAMLIAEDHSGWDAVTKLPAQGGLGFDATWDAAFYHSLIGDSNMAGGRPRLLKQAGFGWNDALAMDGFSGELYATRYNRVVYHESHDEAGNASGTARTIVVAVNNAPLAGAARPWAEARTRVAAGLSVLSAGTPMFFMGEEVGAARPYTVMGFMNDREDILGERAGNGQALFRFYQDLITLARRFHGVRSHNIDILHQSNANRVVAFKRWEGSEEVIVVASLNDHAFPSGYVIQKDLLAIPDAGWKEVLNSDGAGYGGQDVGNGGAIVRSSGGRLNVVIPAVGVLVFVKQ